LERAFTLVSSDILCSIREKARTLINANVITRQFRAEMAAYWREKEMIKSRFMIIFFSSMAHHYDSSERVVIHKRIVWLQWNKDRMM
jgi:hypothetical protein